MKMYNKRQHKRAPRALDPQKVARLCGGRYISERP
jgi:hypothetical protein